MCGRFLARLPIRWARNFAPWVAASALGFAALPAGAQAPVGGEFQVNTYTTGVQYYPAVAADADGDFVVVWTSHGSSGTDTDGYSIQGQRYSANGSTQGGEFQVNTYTTDTQYLYPSVAADADGDFVVVWTSRGSSGTDTHSFSIQGQRYASNGSAQGAQFQVNTYTTASQSVPAVAADADGDFVVVWNSIGSPGTDTSGFSIQGQRYTSNGSTQGAQFQLNTYTTGFQFVRSVAADADGDFVVVWESNASFGTDTSFDSIQAQRYASDGSTLGSQFQVNTYTTSGQGSPSVTAEADGDFVVVWMSYGSFGTDASYVSIQGQRYTSNGSAQGAQFQVNTYTTNKQWLPSAAADADGDFVVAWHSYGSSGTDTSDYSIQGQRYASDGSTQGGEFQINTYTTDDQMEAAVAVDTNGDFVVLWQSNASSGTDTSGFSIHGQRYSVPAPPEPPPIPAMSPATRFVLAAALLLLGATYALRRRA